MDDEDWLVDGDEFVDELAGDEDEFLGFLAGEWTVDAGIFGFLGF